MAAPALRDGIRDSLEIQSKNLQAIAHIIHFSINQAALLMTAIYSFPPQIANNSRVLILGSMPGVVSLQMGQYYAHPQNTFWKIMGDLLNAGPELPYAKRMAKLHSHKIGLWDVLKSCKRSTSLDSDIKNPQPNDFATLYADMPALTHVFFNGSKAEAAYRRYVMPQLGQSCAHLLYARLPSTSPANASITYAEKLQAWRGILLNS